MKVRDIMTSDVMVATTTTPINQIAKSMKDLNVGVMPIIDNNQHPVGIVTDRDLVIRGMVSNINTSDTVEKVMSKHVISVTPDMHVHEAARIMGENQIRRLPVVENGKMVGMVSIGDLAVHGIYENEAGSALSQISTPSRPMM
ncbi:CBS domain-containing protein [Alkaliphilus hydrothermalis]|uniref:CBS domain-containing protein n=1 Tax=Alkaliphilus hydrothermalis TaxID=1482730 RepID=A0ABS2NNK2_9FIRM|nr:CBS domain-containing protein [Alkaliphilus hydrothermalis]MBM7614436.1 CBS domain-containing protein [Alkaliphilus hydrothermalis]